MRKLTLLAVAAFFAAGLALVSTSTSANTLDNCGLGICPGGSQQCCRDGNNQTFFNNPKPVVN